MIETPLCDRLERDSLDSNDLRAWKRLACRLEAEGEVWRREREWANTHRDALMGILHGIYALLWPEDVDTPKGRMTFAPPDDPMYRDSYRLLSERIRAIPEEVKKAKQRNTVFPIGSSDGR